jgi:uncharacterized protein with HEPN domain
VKGAIRVRLHDMVEAIEGIEGTAAGVTFAQHQQSWQVRWAVEAGVEIISEASRHLPEELKLRYPHVYWREIAGIGNLLRHEYGRTGDRIMWRVVQKYLPELKVAVLDMLELQGPSTPRP